MLILQVYPHFTILETHIAALKNLFDTVPPISRSLRENNELLITFSDIFNFYFVDSNTKSCCYYCIVNLVCLLWNFDLSSLFSNYVKDSFIYFSTDIILYVMVSLHY